MDPSNAVNEHYLGHVVQMSEDTDVEAGEDIFASNGIKLLSKRARIDGKTRDLLLQHKLTKPLETMVRVIDGVGTRRIDRVAEAMLDQHPLLAYVCGQTSARLLADELRNLVLTPQVDSLLSVYAAHAPGKLEHAVGIALLSAAMGHDFGSTSGCESQTLILAGLLHDVGELYIDPAYLKAGTRLQAKQWKHIATHPIVGARVLKEMPGAGAQVSSAVLHHHERLDGFGYPQGARADRTPMAGQVLAVSELLMGLMESGANHGLRADIAMKLVPGEFNRALLDRVVTAARRVQPKGHEANVMADELAAGMSSLARSLRNLREVKTIIASESAGYSEALRRQLDEAVQRCERIRIAFASTGLEGMNEQRLGEHLSGVDDNTLMEIGIVLRELQWRLSELERFSTIRAERLSTREARKVQQLLGQIVANPQPAPELNRTASTAKPGNADRTRSAMSTAGV
ncbi:MAG TPA: HD domain-containing phosphohydrolase [Burkholderiaceae bacterium]|nr:HD domain-containing phosphohydrolase [Burkholderiaceae bacterium]